jgi:uncharacterized repeat protein (TIGR01451 family)
MSMPGSRRYAVLCGFTLILSALQFGSVSALTSVDFMVLNDSENADMLSAVIDHESRFAYFGIGGILAAPRLYRIDLNDFSQTPEPLTPGSSDHTPSTAVIDRHGDFVYFGIDGDPGRVIRIDTEDFSIDSSLTLDSDNRTLISGVADPIRDYAYFGTRTNPRRVVRINLADFELAGTIELNDGEGNLRSAVVDPDGEYAYFGTEDSPGRIVKIRLENFEHIETITLEEDENDLRSAVIDSAGKYAYFGTNTVPGGLVKVDLDTFTRLDGLEFSDSLPMANRTYSAVIDPDDAFAYLGMSSGRLVKVDLENFERVATVAFFSTNPYLASVIDSSGEFAYFGSGAYQNDKSVSKVSLAAMAIEKSVLSVNGDDEPPLTYSAVDDVISYTITATNAGSTLLTGVEISDPDIDEIECTWSGPDGEIEVSGRVDCEASYTITLSDMDAGSFVNIAMAVSDQTSIRTDSASIDAEIEPEITLTKSITAGDLYAATGDTISYALTAENTGNVTLENVSIADDGADLENCNPAIGSALGPGESLSCDGTYDVTQADIDAGSYTNDASAQATDVNETEVSSNAAVTATADQNPHIDLNKLVVSGDGYSEPGDFIEYFIGLSNTGNVTLTDVQISDPHVDDFSCSPQLPTTLSPGASVNCSGGVYAVTQDDIDEGSFINTATASASDPNLNPVETMDSATASAQQNPAISMQQSIDEGETFDRAGQTIRYSITASNDGNVTLDNVAINESAADGFTCSPELPASLAPGENLACGEGIYTVTQEDIDEGTFTNVTVLTAVYSGSEPIEISGSATATADQQPAISLEKTIIEGRFFADAGDTITYSLEATNTGNVTLSNVEISDPIATIEDCQPSDSPTLAPDETAQCTGVLQPLGNALYGGDQGLLLPLVFPAPGTPVRQQLDLGEAHGIDVGISQQNGALERGVAIEQAVLPLHPADHVASSVELIENPREIHLTEIAGQCRVTAGDVHVGLGHGHFGVR